MKKQALINIMTEGTVDHGWDIIAAFNRGKCNRLLALQYLTNLASQKVNFIKDGEVKNDSTYYIISNLVLGQPRLSFENATLENSKAKMVLPFISGRIDVEYYSEQENIRYLKEVIEISEGHQYVLTVDITLKGGAVGNIEQGKITLDLVDDGINFMTNISDSSLANKAIGDHFEKLFKTGDLPVKKYELGQFAENSASPLNPKEFRLLTMSSDPTRKGQTEDGAVLAFIRANNTGTGSLPTTGSGFPYLIPDDTDADGNPLYDSALVVSNNTLSRDFLQEPLKALPAATTSVIKKDNFSSTLVTATLTGAGTDTSWTHINLGSVIHYSAYSNTDKDNKTVITLENITYAARDNKLTVSYSGKTSFPAKVFTIVNGALNPAETGTITVGPTASFQYKLVTDAENLTLSFVKETDPTIDFEMLDDSLLANLHGETKQALELAGQLKETISVPLQQLAVSIKDFELFPTANLLFPEQNAFKLISADLPGDILVLGQLDPKSTAMEITPLTGFVGITKTLQFSLIESYVQTAAAMTWEVFSIDGKTKGLGTITASGLYTAPDKTQVDQASLQELVVATNGAKVAKAMVTVVANSVAIDPAFYFTAAGATNSDGTLVTLPLNAITAPGTDDIDWVFADNTAGGTLEKNGRSATYTPPAKVTSGAYALDLVAAKNSNTDQTTSCAVLNFTKPTGYAVGMVKLLPEGDLFVKPSEKVTINADPGLEEEAFFNREIGRSFDAQLKAVWSRISTDRELLKEQDSLPQTFAEFRQQIRAEGDAVFTIIHGGGTLVDTSYEMPNPNPGEDPILVDQVEYTAPATITAPCAVVVYYYDVTIKGKKYISYNYKIVRFPPSELSGQ